MATPGPGLRRALHSDRPVRAHDQADTRASPGGRYAFHRVGAGAGRRLRLRADRDPHACVDYKQLAEWAQLIVDTRNAMPFAAASPRYVKA